MPIFMVAYKVKMDNKDMVKKDLAVEILSNIIFVKSSKLYQKLYNEGLIFSELGFDFDFARNYAHYAIQGTSENPEKVIEEIKNEIDFYLNQGISSEDFDRVKKKVYGDMVKDYNDVRTIGNHVMAYYFRGINIFDFFFVIDSVSKEYAEQVLREIFDENKKVISIVKPKEN